MAGHASTEPGDLKWFVDRLRMSIFAECALSLPDTAKTKSASEIAPQIAFLSKLVARETISVEPTFLR